MKTAQDYFADDTREAFQQAYQGKPTLVEWVQYIGGPRIRHQLAQEAFTEELEYTDAQNALWKVLQQSQCPLVAELKKVIEDSYIKRWADDIAEIRGTD